MSVHRREPEVVGAQSERDADWPLEASALICFGTRSPRILARSKGGANELLGGNAGQHRCAYPQAKPRVPFVDDAPP